MLRKPWTPHTAAIHFPTSCKTETPCTAPPIASYMHTPPPKPIHHPPLKSMHDHPHPPEAAPRRPAAAASWAQSATLGGEAVVTILLNIERVQRQLQLCVYMERGCKRTGGFGPALLPDHACPICHSMPHVARACMNDSGMPCC